MEALGLSWCNKHNNCYALAFRTGPKAHVKRLFNELSQRNNQTGQDCCISLQALEEARKYFFGIKTVSGKPKSDKAYHTRNRELFDNWKQKILDGAVVGHRYFCLESL